MGVGKRRSTSIHKPTPTRTSQRLPGDRKYNADSANEKRPVPCTRPIQYVPGSTIGKQIPRCTTDDNSN